MTIFTHVEAFSLRYGLVCTTCGANMHIALSDDRQYTRAQCLSRHCAQYRIVGELPNERVKMLAVADDLARGASEVPVIDVTPEKVGGND